jgi:hypothetical protein
MAWQQKDEWLDPAAETHTVVFHNPDVLVPSVSAITGRDVYPRKLVPLEHHLIHHFGGDTCRLCGRATPAAPVDFEKVKQETLEALHAHHRAVMEKLEQNPTLRTGSGPK